MTERRAISNLAIFTNPVPGHEAVEAIAIDRYPHNRVVAYCSGVSEADARERMRGFIAQLEWRRGKWQRRIDRAFVVRLTYAGRSLGDQEVRAPDEEWAIAMAWSRAERWGWLIEPNAERAAEVISSREA